MGRPYGLLRVGFPYLKTVGMRRVTNFPVDLAIGKDGTLYVLCRSAGAAQISRLTLDDDDLGPISGYGTDDGKLQAPAAIVVDRDENLFVSDDALHGVTILGKDGTFLARWGEHGVGEGQLDRPSGLAFDPEGNLYVVDTFNHRVQKFTRDGRFLAAWGRHGNGEGELSYPWGIAVDELGDVYVADWRNDRVQQFTAAGQLRRQVGRPGNGDGELNRPAGVAVDRDGDVYVADTGNNRVQLFNAEGRYVEKFVGDATLSRSGRDYMLANARPNRLRDMANLEPQKRFRGPKAVRVDDQGRMYVPDYGAYRIQIYQKEVVSLQPDQMVPPLRSPSLQTT
ncbi:MAG TPA: NHL repeat-containing protein [Chloroflexota bacterium]|jgi:streptogramin lyase|nr:NHL repeat-containing protein [Chloroflexota bacterium]